LVLHLGQLAAKSFESGLTGVTVLVVDVHDGPLHGAESPYAAPERTRFAGAACPVSVLSRRDGHNGVR